MINLCKHAQMHTHKLAVKLIYTAISHTLKQLLYSISGLIWINLRNFTCSNLFSEKCSIPTPDIRKQTTSSLLRITLQDRLRVNNEQSLEGAMYIYPMVQLLLPITLLWVQIFQNNDGFRRKKTIHKAFRIHKTPPKQNP